MRSRSSLVTVTAVFEEMLFCEIIRASDVPERLEQEETDHYRFNILTIASVSKTQPPQVPPLAS